MSLKRFFGFCAGFLAALLVLTAVALGLVVSANMPPAALPAMLPVSGLSGAQGEQKEEPVLFEVRSGESAASVGERLAEARVIKSAFFWNMFARFSKDYLKAGTYRIEPPLKMLAVYSLLASGDELLVPVTVPEGFTLKKTAALWSEAGVCSADAFMRAATDAAGLARYHIAGASFEGYLFPDTYRVPPSYPAEKVVGLMADTFFKRLADFGAPELTPKDLQNTVTLASIVEREYRRAAEAPLIAGVFVNRLDRGMRLESCATVEYVLTEIEGRPHPKRLWEKDIKISSPYNTYVVSGLPPGPIASPGERALKAAFFPQKSEYLFFRLVDSGAGTHYFSRTFDDHIKAAALLVKG